MSSGVTRRAGLVLLLMLSALGAGANTVSVHENAASGLLTWKVEDRGFSIELIQLIPDFVRAVYARHRFPADEVERIAGYCVFGTILKNTADQPMHYRVADWRYRTPDGVEHPVKTKSQWLAEWKKSNIVFSWTLLPDAGEFEVGDWQQGFTTIALPREAHFDFIYTWRINGKNYRGEIKDMRCAPQTLDAERLKTAE